MTAPNRLITLNNGVRMPVLGFGVFQVPDEQTEQVVTDSLEAGYRSIDAAASYSDDEMTRIAALDTGASLFFDHRDPAMVGWLGARRVD